MDSLTINGAWAYTPDIHHDSRGSFCELFRGREFLEHVGYRFDISQANFSVSRQGVIRGIHYTEVPPGQAKYVMCVNGAVVDIVVDLRTGSATFGRWEAVRLDEQERRAVFLSEGLGHAFMAVTPHAMVCYLCSTPYSPGIERGVHPLDPEIGVDWPQRDRVVLSAKDAAAPSLAEAGRSGLLPSLAACARNAASLRAARGAAPGVATR